MVISIVSIRGHAMSYIIRGALRGPRAAVTVGMVIPLVLLRAPLVVANLRSLVSRG